MEIALTGSPQSTFDLTAGCSGEAQPQTGDVADFLKLIGSLLAPIPEAPTPSLSQQDKKQDKKQAKSDDEPAAEKPGQKTGSPPVAVSPLPVQIPATLLTPIGLSITLEPANAPSPEPANAPSPKPANASSPEPANAPSPDHPEGNKPAANGAAGSISVRPGAPAPIPSPMGPMPAPAGPLTFRAVIQTLIPSGAAGQSRSEGEVAPRAAVQTLTARVPATPARTTVGAVSSAVPAGPEFITAAAEVTTEVPGKLVQPPPVAAPAVDPAVQAVAPAALPADNPSPVIRHAETAAVTPPAAPDAVQDAPVAASAVPAKTAATAEPPAPGRKPSQESEPRPQTAESPAPPLKGKSGPEWVSAPPEPDPVHSKPAEADTGTRPSVRLEPEVPKAPPSTPVREIAVRVADSPASKVDLHVVERAGRILVDVRSSNPVLSQSLQAHVDDLVRRLDTKGFSAETWIPSPSAASNPSGTSSGTDTPGNRDGQPGNSPGRGDGGSQSRATDQDPRQHQRRNQAAWADYFDDTLNGRMTAENRRLSWQ